MGVSEDSDYTTPSAETVPEVVHNDMVRYKRKGYGFVAAAVLMTVFLTVVPKAMQSVFPSLIEGWNENLFFCVTITVLHFLLNVIIYTVYYFVYTLKLPFLEKYRVANDPWPWQANQERWKSILKESAFYYSMNNFVAGPILLSVETFMSGASPRFGQDSYPKIIEIICQLFFCMIVEDFCFYWGHRLLHHPKLYPHVHKIHHKYTHTISIANEFTHPFEFILSNVIPTVMGPKLLGKNMHLITYWMWITFRVGESIDGHSGYDFSFSPYRLLPLSGSANYHDFHHSANVGNYCSLFTFWDTVFGTNSDYWSWLSKHEKEGDNAGKKSAPVKNLKAGEKPPTAKKSD
jgi:sterol desaturase/sphingolipid hydroxylase (fatty acid hydroxylase superfamily)